MPRSIDTAMAAELREIPSLLRRASTRWQADVQAAMAPASDRPVRMVVGRGSSGHAALFASDLHAQRSGRPAIDLRPSQAGALADRRDDDAVAWIYSASGQSPDVVHAADWLRRRGAWVVAITNAIDRGVGLVGAASHTIWIDAGPERAIPATKSFVAQLYVGAALAGFDLALAAEPTASAIEALLLGDAPEELAARLATARSVVVTGHGLGWTAAKDGALKLQEAARRMAIALTPAELLHGPVAAVDPGAVVIWLWETPPAAELYAQVTAAVARRGAALITAGVGAADFPIPPIGPSWALTPVLFAFIAETALELAALGSLDPDRPAGLAKITRT